MKEKKKLPIGIEDFSDIRMQGFYYVDKTRLIIELLEDWGKVNLFTRPRRFGKSLNMSMLKYFFEIGTDEKLFDGLEISQNEKLCREYMGKFPVIAISLKGINSMNYETARAMLIRIINDEVDRLRSHLELERLSAHQQKSLERLMDPEMADVDLINSLRFLSVLLYRYYGQKAVILIDEYDVPLDKAFANGYYDQMVMLIRNLFEQALKTNEGLYFAVLTGCLRIAKESIFTGLNNFKILSITNGKYDECFGFTDQEVRQLLEQYGLAERYEIVRQWYDGYRFGGKDVYCPWDVLCYCDNAVANPLAEPEAYWTNTSSNNIVKRFISKANKGTQREIEQLMAGESIRKEIRQELTYNEIDKTIENLWSVLFMTGYLTSRGLPSGGNYQLVIPNQEVRKIFETQIGEWFRELAYQDQPKLSAFCEAFHLGDAEAVQEQFNAYLRKTISIRDTFAGKEKKENFYHGILLGLLSSQQDWVVSSNVESGDGYSDILVEIEEEQTGILIEIKYAENDSLEKSCAAAIRQIEEKRYVERLQQDGMKKIRIFGIACFRKHCKVACEDRS